MDELESVKRRVKKLLALSKSPNENEAISALRKANCLMAEFQIDKTEFSDYTHKSVKSTKRAVEWRSILANAVEQLYATYHFRDKDTGCFDFYGEELDVFMSTEMFAYLVKTIDRMVFTERPQKCEEPLPAVISFGNRNGAVLQNERTGARLQLAQPEGT